MYGSSCCIKADSQLIKALKGYILFLMLELSVHEMGSQEGDMNVKEE